jgi:hypothetical protein
MTPIDLQRIKDYEYKFSEVSGVMAALDMALDEYTDIKSYIGDLKDYMDSGQWLKDFEADERGEIPSDIERGVLSEDGLYDLLESVDKILKRARGI